MERGRICVEATQEADDELGWAVDTTANDEGVGIRGTSCTKLDDVAGKKSRT